ncbi:MAG: beta-carotene 15,15-monooxygenase [Bacteroidetes bacterium]|jgi:hypothetical protein|nr:beta-carotene 15,15-monooxygenase [Bacteroidota bacterium]MDF2450608.1 beta-carotene 15,15-monooxygenase [Bacteroidota bacterium]
MIVGPLKSNIQFSIILLLLFCIGAWIGTFGFTNAGISVINYKEHILYSYTFDHIFSFTLRQVITLFIILTGAFFTNFLAIEQEITSKTNYLPAFFYILFAFSANTKGLIEPVLTANVLILPALYFLMNSYRQDYALAEFFKSGLFMGLASFFCIHYIVIFPLNFIALIILRPFNWREWTVHILGLLTPLYIYVGVCYLTSTDAFAVFSMMKEATSSAQKPVLSEYYMAIIFVSLLAIVFALIHYVGKGFGGKVKTKKTKYILLWMLLLCFIMLFFEQMSDMILLPCIIPLSIIIGDYLSEIKQLKIANTLMILFIGGFAIIYLHALDII